MSCECYKIGGKFIAEDPNCQIHGENGLLCKEEILEKIQAEVKLWRSGISGSVEAIINIDKLLTDER